MGSLLQLATYGMLGDYGATHVEISTYVGSSRNAFNIDSMIVGSVHVNCGTNEFELCSICHDATANVQTSCAHLFCKPCLAEWFKQQRYITNTQTCPYCRQTVVHLKTVKNRKQRKRNPNRTKKHKT